MTRETPQPYIVGAKGSAGDVEEVLFGRDTEPEEPRDHHTVEVPVESIERNMSEFLTVIEKIFIQAEKQAAKMQQTSEDEGKFGMQLEQIEMSIDVDGKGKVSLFGFGGAEVGGKGGIKLTFKRQG